MIWLIPLAAVLGALLIGHWMSPENDGFTIGYYFVLAILYVLGILAVIAGLVALVGWYFS